MASALLKELADWCDERIHMDDSMETLRVHTLSQAAKLLHVSLRTLDRMIYKQELSFRRVR